jgi:hypothetical protein
VCPLLDFGGPVDFSAYDGVYKAMGIIATGSAAGVARADVARALVDCIRGANCAQTFGFQLKPQRCWCDHDFTSTTGVSAGSLCSIPADTTDPDPYHPKDPNHFIPGKCAQEYADASEVDTGALLLAGLNATGTAEGAANRLLENCDTRDCTEECLPNYFGHGVAATITADIVALRNQAGESALGDLVADSQRAVAMADFAFVRADFIADSELQTDLLFAATPNRGADADGRVLWSEARAVHLGHTPGIPYGTPQPIDRPVESSIYKATFTGQQIYDALSQQLDPTAGGMLHVSGLSYTWDEAQPLASRLVEVRKGGVPLDKSANYTVALGGTLIAPTGPILALSSGANATAVPGVQPAEVLGEYLSTLPQPVAPPTRNRITRLN